MRTILAAATLAAAHAVIAPAFIAPACAAPGPNGGETKAAEDHGFEFLATDREIAFFVTEHDGTPMGTGETAAKVFVTVGGRTQIVPLKPVAPNKLVGALSTPLAPGAKLVLTAKLHGVPVQVRFEK